MWKANLPQLHNRHYAINLPTGPPAISRDGHFPMSHVIDPRYRLPCFVHNYGHISNVQHLQTRPFRAQWNEEKIEMWPAMMFRILSLNGSQFDRNSTSESNQDFCKHASCFLTIFFVTPVIMAVHSFDRNLKFLVFANSCPTELPLPSPPPSKEDNSLQYR